jgi:hypothetical protein
MEAWLLFVLHCRISSFSIGSGVGEIEGSPPWEAVPPRSPLPLLTLGGIRSARLHLVFWRVACPLRVRGSPVSDMRAPSGLPIARFPRLRRPFLRASLKAMHCAEPAACLTLLHLMQYASFLDSPEWCPSSPHFRHCFFFIYFLAFVGVVVITPALVVHIYVYPLPDATAAQGNLHVFHLHHSRAISFGTRRVATWVPP